MSPSECFKFCPRCAARRATTASPLQCEACGFLYYFNPCCAVAGFLLNQEGEALFLRRAKEPARGRLALPGGFIDIGETAEESLRRETREEVDLEIGELTYLCTQVNSYHYQEITYPVLDVFFVTCAHNPTAARPLDGVESLFWAQPEKVSPEEIAFPSIRAALHKLVSQRCAES